MKPATRAAGITSCHAALSHRCATTPHPCDRLPRMQAHDCNKAIGQHANRLDWRLELPGHLPCPKRAGPSCAYVAGFTIARPQRITPPANLRERVIKTMGWHASPSVTSPAQTGMAGTAPETCRLHDLLERDGGDTRQEPAAH